MPSEASVSANAAIDRQLRRLQGEALFGVGVAIREESTNDAELVNTVLTSRPAVTDRNVANLIRDWLVAEWQPFTVVDGIWFTGSSVWSHLYGKIPRPGADLDIVVDNNTWDPNQQMEVVLNICAIHADPNPPNNRTRTSVGGHLRYTTMGRVDVWRAQHSLHIVLQRYPSEYGHCRAAYSFEYGLLVLPNEHAR